MSRGLRHRRDRGFPCLAFAAVVFACGVPASIVAGEPPSGLEEPMQPIAKGKAATSVCRYCAEADMRDGSGQRVAERAAPEYPAPRHAGADEGGMTTGMGPAGSDGSSLLSLPGAAVALPAILP